MQQFSLCKTLDINHFPNDEFQSPKLKVFADNNFKFEENAIKFSKYVENIVGKAENMLGKGRKLCRKRRNCL